MATTLTAPAAGVDIEFSFPITKWEEGPGGTLFVYGKATDGSVDTDEQIVDPDWSAKALQEWLDSAPAVRMQHNGSLPPAGSGVQVDLNRDGDGGHWVKSAVDEPTAKELVKKGHLRAYSVGIARPVIERDVTGKARGGIIKGGRLVEISLVDSPANKNCMLEIAKSDSSGAPEFTGKMLAGADLLTKAAAAADTEPAGGDGVTVNLNVTGSVPVQVTPADLAKMLKRKTKPALPVAANPADNPDDTDDDADDADLGKSLTADEKATFSAQLKNDPTSDISSAIHRLSQWAGSGNLPTGTSHGDLNWMYNQCAKELRRRDPKSDAGGNFPTAGSGKAATADAADGAQAAEKCKALTDILASIKDRTTPDASKTAAAADAGKGDAAMEQCSLCDGKGKIRGGHLDCPDCHGKGKVPAAEAAARKAALDEQRAARKAARRAVRDALTTTTAPAAAAAEEPAAPATPGTDKTSTADTGKGDDVACLGCGHDLDDDARFCPNCGKATPKSGAAAKTDTAAPATETDPPAKAKKAKKAKKGKPTPADGVTGMHADPVPAHREPDGPAIEAYEHDAGLPTDPDSEMKAALRLKSIGVPAELGALHDTLCAAFHPADTTKCHPTFDLGGLDVGYWQTKALDTAASAPLDVATRATMMWQHAVTLKGADPGLVDQLRTEAHKAFQDANPGPGSAPTPTELSPARFKRPYITAGHAAASTGQDGPNSAPIPPMGGISAAQYDRGFLDAGHAADSPANKDDALVPPPAQTGRPTRTYYTNVGRNNAIQAMRAMHDHIAQTFPDLCPMNQGADEQQIMSRPVPTPGATPDAAAIKTDGQPGEKAGKKAAKRLRRQLEEQVLKGEISLADAQAQLGLAPTAPAAAPAEPAPAAPVEKAATVVSADVIKTAVAEATAELAAQLADTRKALRKQAKLLDRIAEQPDTSMAPYRGAAQLHKSSAGPVGAQPVASTAERTQALITNELEQQFRTSPDPAQREAAWTALMRLRGIPATPTV